MAAAVPRTFVMGDIHGAFRALRQCLERSQFILSDDVLICLGDVCDGWPETRQSIDELLKIKHLIYIKGNHDAWALQWMKKNEAEDIWLDQGGRATMQSYDDEKVPADHVDLLDKALPYYLHNDKLFVHAGIIPDLPLSIQGEEVFLWDRSLVYAALRNFGHGKHIPLTSYKEVYVGHTPVPGNVPEHSGDVWMMDTGAGWAGPLTIMNIDTKQIYQSDPVPALYPGIKGR